MLRFKEYLFGSLNYSSSDSQSDNNNKTEITSGKPSTLGKLSKSINDNRTRLKTLFLKSENKRSENSEVFTVNGEKKAKKKYLKELSENLTKLKDAVKDNKLKLAAGLAGTIALSTGATAFGLLTKSVVDQNNFIANADKLNLNGAYLAHQDFIKEYLNIVNSPNSLHFLQNDAFKDLVTNDKLKNLFTSLSSGNISIIELTSNSNFLKLIQNENFIKLLGNKGSLDLLLQNSELFTKNFDSIQQILGNESMIKLMQNQDLVKLLGDDAFREFLLNPNALSQYYSNGPLNVILNSKYTDFLNNNKELLNNPKIQELLSDSKILDLIKDGKLNELYQNETIKNLLNNPTLKDLLANQDMLKILGDQEIVNLLNNPEIMNALNNPEFINMLQANGFAEMISQNGIVDIIKNPDLLGYLDVMNKPPLESVNKEAIIGLGVATLIFGIATAICLMIANRKGKDKIMEKVEDLESELDKRMNTLDETSKNQEANLDKTKRDLDNLKDLESELGKRMNTLDETSKNQEANLDKTKRDLNKLNENIKDIEREIDNLEGELENKTANLEKEDNKTKKEDMGFTNPNYDFENDENEEKDLISFDDICNNKTPPTSPKIDDLLTLSKPKTEEGKNKENFGIFSETINTKNSTLKPVKGENLDNLTNSFYDSEESLNDRVGSNFLTKQEGKKDPSSELNTTHEANRGSGYKRPQTPDSN